MLNMKYFLLLSLLMVGIVAKRSKDFDFLEEILGFHIDPDVTRNVSELISSKGYPVEIYDVQTKDGYILSVQRIPHGIKNNNGRKGSVLLQHGLLSSATDFVINAANESLGFILADAGYDVWLGNSRGNTYSKRHVKYNPRSKEFWTFSFDEMGKYDLPATIDFILNKTQDKQIFYIGHSQGTTAGYVMLSQFPEYNKKVKLMIGLAPVAYVGYISSPIRYLAPFTKDVEFLFNILGVNEFLPNNILMKYLSETVCDSKIRELCSDVVFLLCGEDMAQLNMTRLPIYVSHTPAGASTQCIVHYAQMINSRKFQMFDHGKKQNMVHYNQSTPPEYHLENITAPTAIISAKNDKLADPVDVALLQQKLKTLVSSTCVRDPLFNHIDFVWGMDAAHSVYQDVLALLGKYST